MLLHLGGDDVFEISESHTLAEDTYAQTKEKLSAYFTPKRNIEYEIFMFRQATQHPTEVLDKYHARLCQLAKNCEFHDKDAEIKSQIIQRCQLIKVRNKGLSEPTLTLKELLTFGRTLEATNVQAKAMSGGVEVEKPIHRIEHKPQQKYHQPRKPKREGKQGSYSSSSKTQHQRLQDNRKCSGCGGNHGVGKRDKLCPAWGKQCHKCQRMNHFSSVCKATTPQQAAKTHFVQTKSPAEHELTMPTDEYELPLYKSDTIGSHVKPYMCTVTLNGIPTMMEIDTGATTSLISEAQFKQIQIGKLNLSLMTEGLPKLRTY
ncbi:uncharacterized protein LOC117114547 [Anneissia japonica]|uniref:uncharacterized protein LOC117114547 n=1 Tax=Anneissia japonica TaxID=1529436 RepID=UPI0014255DE3|nr:uncharacterized protein LOC117114547 [Anneissia japonica]